MMDIGRVLLLWDVSRAFQSGLISGFSLTKAGYGLTVESKILRDGSRKASSGRLVSDLAFTVILKARNVLKIQGLVVLESDEFLDWRREDRSPWSKSRISSAYLLHIAKAPIVEQRNATQRNAREPSLFQAISPACCYETTSVS